jgi:hypothetical protein
MAGAPLLTEEQLDALRQFDTCMIANAVETFNVRLRNTGFTDASIQCMFTDAPPMVGYAVTARLRSGNRLSAAARFVTEAISGIASLKFLRHGSWYCKTWIIRVAEGHSSEICMPRS